MSNKQLPAPTNDDSKLGWSFDYDFLETVDDQTHCYTRGNTLHNQLDHINCVLLALVDMGFLEIEGQ